ncbi:glycosyltransferase family 2 protein [bacterium]|nr:glycosyltransferase family 2 protein [bacterium]
MISIIVPTLDEAVHIGNTLDRAREGTNTELIVVDGGSADGTVDLAGACGARVIVHPPGRARQMNAAAAEAEGDILLFVHADTLLPEGFDGHIRRTLSAPGVAAGAFEFRVDSHPRGMKLIERMTNWRSKKLQMPYGDQTLFIEAGTFHRVGGFPELPLMEDFELVRRLKRQGRVVTAPAPAISSARRWRQRGTLRATLLNQVIIAAYFLGVSPARLARWYYGKREGEGGAPSTGRRPEK